MRHSINITHGFSLHLKVIFYLECYEGTHSYILSPRVLLLMKPYRVNSIVPTHKLENHIPSDKPNDKM